jgi:DNA-binding LytR/AlgR family response regulator
MRSIIIDDEEPARSRLARLLKAHPAIEVVGEARDGVEAVQKIEALQPDLVFLDIELPGLTGFEVLEAIPASAAMPLVIFVTGYDEHALAAFEANALAYLLKPVEPQRLSKAVERASKLSGESERQHLLRVARETPKTLRQVVCRKRDRVLLMTPEQILWFAVEDGLVKAHTAAETFWVNYHLTELEVSLPQDQFFRARREVLVNLTRVKEIRPYFKSGFLLVMADAAGTEIAVSERQAHTLRQRIPGL